MLQARLFKQLAPAFYRVPVDNNHPAAVLAGEIRLRKPPPLMGGERERPAQRRPLQRRSAGVGAAAGKHQAEQQDEKRRQARGNAFVHDSGSLALLRPGDQA